MLVKVLPIFLCLLSLWTSLLRQYLVSSFSLIQLVLIILCHSMSFLSSSSSWVQKSWQTASTHPVSCPLPIPDSPMRWANIPHISFHVLSGYINSVSLTWAARAGKSIGTTASCMSGDTCESINYRHSVPFLSVGILGADDFVISYFIDYLLFSGK